MRQHHAPGLRRLIGALTLGGALLATATGLTACSDDGDTAKSEDKSSSSQSSKGDSNTYAMIDDLCTTFDLGKMKDAAGKKPSDTGDSFPGMEPKDGEADYCNYETESTPGEFDAWTMAITVMVHKSTDGAKAQYDKSIEDKKAKDKEGHGKSESIGEVEGDWDQAQRFQGGLSSTSGSDLFAQHENLSMSINIFSSQGLPDIDEANDVTNDLAEQAMTAMKQ